MSVADRIVCICGQTLVFSHTFFFFHFFCVSGNGIDHHRSFVECMESQFSCASSCSFVLWHCNVCTNLCDIAFGLARNPSEKWSAANSQLGNEQRKREKKRTGRLKPTVKLNHRMAKERLNASETCARQCAAERRSANGKYIAQPNKQENKHDDRRKQQKKYWSSNWIKWIIFCFAVMQTWYSTCHKRCELKLYLCHQFFSVCPLPFEIWAWNEFAPRKWWNLCTERTQERTQRRTHVTGPRASPIELGREEKSGESASQRKRIATVQKSVFLCTAHTHL